MLVIEAGPSTVKRPSSQMPVATRVIVSDHHYFRVKMAVKLGIDYAFNAKKVNVEERVKKLTRSRDAGLMIVASTEASHQGMRLVRWEGRSASSATSEMSRNQT